jgi:hypothetical protein
LTSFKVESLLAGLRLLERLTDLRFLCLSPLLVDELDDEELELDELDELDEEELLSEELPLLLSLDSDLRFFRFSSFSGDRERAIFYLYIFIKNSFIY